jgi:hypothetical protein
MRDSPLKRSPCAKCEKQNRRYCSNKCEALKEYQKYLDSADLGIDTKSSLSGLSYNFLLP